MPSFDWGNLITVIVFGAGLYAAARRWSARVDERLTVMEKGLSDVCATVDKLDTHMDSQALTLARMEQSVVDPLRRFAELEREVSTQAKDLIRLQTHVGDLERRQDEQRAEWKALRDQVHDLRNGRQVAAVGAEVGRLMKEREGAGV